MLSGRAARGRRRAVWGLAVRGLVVVGGEGGRRGGRYAICGASSAAYGESRSRVVVRVSWWRRPIATPARSVEREAPVGGRLPAREHVAFAGAGDVVEHDRGAATRRAWSRGSAGARRVSCPAS